MVRFITHRPQNNGTTQALTVGAFMVSGSWLFLDSLLLVVLQILFLKTFFIWTVLKVKMSIDLIYSKMYLKEKVVGSKFYNFGLKLAS